MRERTAERFSILPFSIGCVSRSSVDVVTPKKSQAEPNPSPPSEEGDEKAKSSNIGERFQKIVKSFKSLPQVFYREEDDDDDDDDEVEMEIGLPTDVQHVAHIGWDGSNTVSNSIKSWDRASELLSLSSLSMRQLELAMAKEGAAASM